jgi:hypothetical protein
LGGAAFRGEGYRGKGKRAWEEMGGVETEIALARAELRVVETLLEGQTREKEASGRKGAEEGIP